MDSITFRLIKAEEAAEACKFGEQEFGRTFRCLYSDKDYEEYISEAYTIDKYLDWINSSDFFVYGAFSTSSQNSDNSVESNLVAYVLAGPCSLPVSDEVLGGVDVNTTGEIKRMYAHPSTFGTGVAASLLVKAIEWMRSGEGQANRDIYLGVYSENPRAMKFYSKYNFKHVGEYEFIAGDQRDREFIMKNSVTN